MATYLPPDFQQQQQQASRSRASSTASGRYTPANYAAQPQAQPQPSAPARLSSDGYRAPPVGPIYPQDMGTYSGLPPQSHPQAMHPAPLNQLQPPVVTAPYPTGESQRPLDENRRYSAASYRSRHSHSPSRSHRSRRSHHSHQSNGSGYRGDRHHHHHHDHDHDHDHTRNGSSRDYPDKPLTRSDTRRPTLGDTIYSLWGGVKNAFGSNDKWERYRMTSSDRHSGSRR